MQWAIAADAPASLKAIAPSIISPDRFSSTHHDGAFNLDTRLHWLNTLCFMNEWATLSGWEKVTQAVSLVFGRTNPKLEAAFYHLPLLEADVAATGKATPFYRDILTHTSADHPYWQVRNHNDCLSQITIPVCLAGGWYDYYLRGVLDSYTGLRAAGQNPYLTVGPWSHSSPGGATVNLQEGLAWFSAYLKGDRSRLRQKPVRIHVMGADEWRELDEWPPAARQSRYFVHPGAKLSTKAPSPTPSSDCYKYDPADPTPAVGGARFDRNDAGQKDNRALEARADVLCYTTAPLENDVDVIGPVRLELYVRSSLTHTDFFGRLCDVEPDGRSLNVCDGLFRIEPGKGKAQPDGSLCVLVDMRATAYRFRAGHQMRLQVSSGAHPCWSRNLGTGEPVATGTGMAVAEQIVFHDAQHPSALVLPIG